MSHHYLDSVIYFCDEKDHNVEAPNKHNLMCNFQSVWSVISNHEDFKQIRPPPNNVSDLRPDIVIIRDEGPRFVLAIDTSTTMGGTKNTIGNVNQAVRRWIQYEIPDGTKLAIVKFNVNATILNNLEKITDESVRQKMMDLIPSSADGYSCVSCGISEAYKILSGGGGTMILISDGNNNTGENISETIPLLQYKQIRAITMDVGTMSNSGLRNLSEQTQGKYYQIAYGNAVQELSDAFLESLAFQQVPSPEHLQYTLFQKEYRNGISSVADTFTVDFTLGRNLQIRVDYQRLENSPQIVLISPSGLQYRDIRVDNTSRIATLVVKTSELGSWRFNVTLNDTYKDPFFLRITSQMNTKVKAPITTRCWIGNGYYISDPSSKGIVIYSEIRHGYLPVKQASVKAYIKKPGSDTPDVLNLLDNGVLADITAGDGVYSAYYTSATVAGEYSVDCQFSDSGLAYTNEPSRQSSIITNDPGFNDTYCCNSEIPDTGTKKLVGGFTRFHTGITFKVGNSISTGDVYPPSRVRDLQVIKMDAGNMTIELQWTAPGDELDVGTVRYYEVKYSTLKTALIHQFETDSNKTLFQAKDVLRGSLQPLLAGAVQFVALQMKNITLNTTYFIALKAIDKYPRYSSLSNIVSVHVPLLEIIPEASDVGPGLIAVIVIASVVAVIGIVAFVYVIIRSR